MRGHVSDGTRVRFKSGLVLVVRATLMGWILRDYAGTARCSEARSALDLTRAVVELDI